MNEPISLDEVILRLEGVLDELEELTESGRPVPAYMLAFVRAALYTLDVHLKAIRAEIPF